MEPYQPISCAFYDELEALATLRKRVQLVYRNELGHVAEIIGIIRNFATRNKAEFLILDSGIEIRLDRLIEVDGKPLAGYCCSAPSPSVSSPRRDEDSAEHSTPFRCYTPDLPEFENYFPGLH